MIYEVLASGIYFRFDKKDWSIGARPLIDILKKKCNAEYLPIEKPEDENWWYCRLEHRDEFFKLKKDYIDKFKDENYNFIKRKKNWR